MMQGARYAVYWAPEADHPLWQAGCGWLGRDPAQPEPGTAPPHRGAPWRYGFHATLKAPMRLAAGCTAEDLLAALAQVAARHRPLVLPALSVGWLGDFLALRPSQPAPQLQSLADDCVTALDALRQPLPAHEEAARSVGLDDEQRALLRRWGYPHVLHRWRFHLTLTDGLADTGVRDQLAHEASAWFAPALSVPVEVRSISLFEEPAPAAPLRLIRRVPLA